MKKAKFFCQISILVYCVLYMGCHFPVYKNVFLDRGKIDKVKRVAVLPFYNLSDSLNADTIMAHVIMAEFVNSQRFDVVKYGDIRELLLEQQLASAPTVDIKTLHLIRKTYKTDAIIIGTVYRYEESKEKGREFLSSAISLSVSLIDTKSGRVIWREEIADTGSTRGYLFEKKDIYPCFGLAKKVANRLFLTILTKNGYSV